MSLKHSHATPANLHVPLNMATGCEEMMGENLDNNSGKANEPCAIKSGANVSLKFPSRSSDVDFSFFFCLTFHYPVRSLRAGNMSSPFLQIQHLVKYLEHSSF